MERHHSSCRRERGDQSLDGKSTRLSSRLTHREVFEVSDYMFPSLTELKEVVSEVFLELLLIWLSRRTTCSIQMLRPCMVSATLRW